jgi:hypothetical protein
MTVTRAPSRGSPPASAPAGDLAPAGLVLRADPRTRLVAGGAVLVGGSPVRVLRLSPAGEAQVRSWFAGSPVPEAVTARKLARRLLDAGIAHPSFPPPPAVPSRAARSPSSPGGTNPAVSPLADGPPAGSTVTVVIPVRDRHSELARCLAGLRDGDIRAGDSRDGDGHSRGARGPRVIVVDDASADPGAIAAIAARYGAEVVRRPVNGGPGAARNTGLTAAGTELVAFLDSDCVPRPGWLDRLLPHFADPAVGAVAPRIVPHQAGTGWLARYEGASSTLDMGRRPSIVRPGAQVPYVPGAALVVRKAAAGSGFAPGLRVGEDVDFVWRLADAGWRVRYEPAARMGHDHRVTFVAWFSRRADYGTSAATLERRHPGAVRPLYASWWTVGAWAAALSGHPAAAVALAGTATALLARRLSRVTGERWPLPVPRSTAPPPAPAVDNSKKQTRLGVGRTSGCRYRHIAPLRTPNNFGEPARPDNSKKRSCWAVGRETGCRWRHIAPLRTPDDAGEPGRSDNSKKRAESVVRAGAVVRAEPVVRAGAAGWGVTAWPLALRWAGGGTVAAARPLGSAISRTWWPAAIPAAIAFPALRRPLAVLVLVPPLLDWAGRRPPLDPVRYVAARLLDDAAYSVGVWHGCVTRRSIRPLLPVIGANLARKRGNP